MKTGSDSIGSKLDQSFPSKMFKVSKIWFESLFRHSVVAQNCSQNAGAPCLHNKKTMQILDELFFLSLITFIGLT